MDSLLTDGTGGVGDPSKLMWEDRFVVIPKLVDVNKIFTVKIFTVV